MNKLQIQIQQVKTKIETCLKNKKYTVLDVIEYPESRDVIITLEGVKFNISISDNYIFSDDENWIKIPYEILKEHKEWLITKSDLFLLRKAKQDTKILQKKIEDLKVKIWNS